MGLRLFLGHGASGTSASMKPFVDGLIARGVAAEAIDLPKRKAEDAVPAFHLVVPSEPDIAVGGHSYGGRVASLANGSDCPDNSSTGQRIDGQCAIRASVRSGAPGGWSG